MAEAGYLFDVVPSSVDEACLAPSVAAAAEYAMHLATAKARDVAFRYPHRLVLGADTVVDCEGLIIGKPRDAEEAEQIVRQLFSRPHKVVTGLALVRLSDGVERVVSETTIVVPKPMTEAQIAEHIAGCSWEGKAGAYAIQETGDAFVDHLEGSLTNVVGLPMELLARVLAEIGYHAK
jgi:septum formation protein